MLEAVLQERCLLLPGLPVIVGVSGGSDSLCLLGILKETGYKLVVAHLNHKLRPEADQEANAVRETARGMGLPVIIDSADVRGWAEQQGYSIEEAARIQRYRFLFRTARAEGAQAVAVGHTADDQVETVLMHFLRGAGLTGLKGMPHRLVLPVFDESIPLVRPILTLWRTDTEAYCSAHGLTPHLDSSNLDETYFRNHLRHTVIPALEKYNPRFKETLVRTAASLQGDYDLLQAVVDGQWKLVLDSSGEGWIAFHTDKLEKCEPALQRNLLRRAGEMLRPGNRDIGYDVLERASKFLQQPQRKRMDFINGLELWREDSKIFLSTYEAAHPGEQVFQSTGEINLTAGETVPVGKGWMLTSQVVDVGECTWEKNDDPWAAWLDLEKTGEQFSIHIRQEGDVFHPLGMGGQSVKVREFFINQKIPHRLRKSWPIIRARGEIAWIPGMRIAHSCRVTKETRRVIHLVMKRLPEET